MSYHTLLSVYLGAHNWIVTSLTTKCQRVVHSKQVVLDERRFSRNNTKTSKVLDIDTAIGKLRFAVNGPICAALPSMEFAIPGISDADNLFLSACNELMTEVI